MLDAPASILYKLALCSWLPLINSEADCWRARMTVLQFAPFASSLTPDFWAAFSSLKIDALKLSEAPIPLRGHYGPGKRVVDRESGQQLSLGASARFEGTAFDTEASPTPTTIGTIVAE